MAINVNPVSPSYYTNAAAASYSNNIAALNSYDELLALENEILSAQQNNISGGTNDTSLATSDLLDLSPAALNILNGIENNESNSSPTATVGTSSLLTVGASTASGTAGDTVSQLALSATQQAQTASIISQFANQPLTQSTFTQISNALSAVGINPQEISIQQLLGAYSYAYEPAFAFNGQLFTDTLASELEDA